MDPYLEGRAIWADLHATLVPRIRARLAAGLPAGYYARLEERVAVPDVSVTEEASPRGRRRPNRTVPEGSILLRTLVPEEHRETYIEILTSPEERLVAAIEILSYSNKVPGPDREDHLETRSRLLASPAHLVEIDLLRAGRRMPMIDPLPPCHYVVLVSPRSMRPTCVVHPLTVRDPLPEIAIPLLGHDSVTLSLGSAFRDAYREARYDRRIDYSAEPAPAFPGDEAAWVRRTALRERRRPRNR